MANREYHWTAAVRIEHWWHAAAMIVLVATGLYIHSPYLTGGGETFAWMKFLHFVFMYVLIFGLLIRAYLSIFSREAADLMEMLPTPKNLAGIPDVLATYLFLKDSHKDYGRYNPLQGLTYFIMGLLLLLMAATGFAMHAGWLHNQFAWVNTALCGVAVTRVVHYLGMWALICLSMVHIYFVIRQDMLQKDRTLMSMVDGYRETP